MNITTVEFAGFTLAVLGVYYALPRKPQNYLLLAASYLFLLSWDAQFAAVYALLTVANFGLAPRIAKAGKGGRNALYLGIVINVLALAFFKHADFFIASAQTALEKLGIRPEIGAIHILLPVGLSFFVVQVISYLFDVRQGGASVITDPVDFALYMAYFPRILSGPIERSRDFLPRLQNKRVIEQNQIGDSAMLVLQGLVRKLMIANLLFALIPSSVFQAPQRFSSPELAIWLFAYAIALYNDFAGYTSIARGVSGFFGIPLAANFNAPYLARNFTEFWRRWHITLSDWLRDYIYTPTVRFLLRRNYSRTHVFSILLPPILTMFVSALWHDLSLNMLLWGGLYSIFLIIERLWMLSHPVKPLDAQPVWRQLLSMVWIFVLVMLAWVPFRTGLSATFDYWSGLLLPGNWIDAFHNLSTIHSRLWNIYIFDVGLLAGLSIALDLIHNRFGEQAIRRLPVPLQALVINLTIFALIIAVLASQNLPPPFVYQGF